MGLQVHAGPTQVSLCAPVGLWTKQPHLRPCFIWETGRQVAALYIKGDKFFKQRRKWHLSSDLSQVPRIVKIGRAETQVPVILLERPGEATSQVK